MATFSPLRPPAEQPLPLSDPVDEPTVARLPRVEPPVDASPPVAGSATSGLVAPVEVPLPELDPPVESSTPPPATSVARRRLDLPPAPPPAPPTPVGGRPAPRRRGWVIAAIALLLLVAIAGALAIVLVSAKASIERDDAGLARIGMPLGGGKIVSVSVVGGREHKLVPVRVTHDDLIVATQPVPANERLQIRAVIRRPGWLAWLDGKHQTVTMSYVTPTASTRTHYLTVGPGHPLQLRFKTPIRAYEVGTDPGKLTRHVLRAPAKSVPLPQSGPAGTVYVAAQIQPWERSSSAEINYFPAGSAASAVAEPAPGTSITPATPIRISFSKPVSKVLGTRMPTLTPATSGSWKRVSSRTVQFTPSGYGFGLNGQVQVALPNDVHLVGGQSGTATSASWTVPNGSLVRAQQLLAQLGYLPVEFKDRGKAVAQNPTAQEAAAAAPPAGRFVWRYRNTPGQLKAQWKPGEDGVVTKGAIMMFESDHGMTTDGVLTPTVWKALIDAAVAGKKSTFGYTFVMVHEAETGEVTRLWHNGHVIVTTPANTGGAGAETALGTYPVFEHLASTTMSGTNADGSTYVDPGILWVSYFNGGDALHYYYRASYGFPQSNGCVEMPLAAAAKIWPYTPVGALVDVST
jgi:hypothetical protein